MTAPRVAVVTGGTGFIGSALVRRLAADGAHVTCLVRRDSERAARVRDMDGVSVVPFDEMPGFAAPAGSVVYNLASYGVRPDQRDPELLVEGNATLLLRLIAAAKRWSAARVVHIGSCAEYAMATAPALVTEQHPLGTGSLYGAAKAAAYLLGTAQARQLGVPMVTLRLFGTYGPGEAPHRLIPHLVSRLSRGERATLTSGEQFRDLTYVDDVVDACLAAARPNMLENLGTYNVCSGTPVKIRTVAETVARVMRRPMSDLGFGDAALRDYETAWLVGDPARFRAATDIKPQVDLEDGIRRSIAALTSAP